MDYQINPPKFRADQLVRFVDHQHKEREGVIRRVETWYTSNLVAHHTYHVHGHGLFRRRLLGEESILSVVEEHPIAAPVRWERGDAGWVASTDG